MLRLEEIRVLIQENVVLRDVSLGVGSGERVAVLGANGAGKSSLIRTILGLLKPVAGRVILDDEEIQGMACHEIAKLGVACVPEGRRVFSDMTVFENLRMGAYIPGARGRIEQSLEEIRGLFPVLAQRMSQRAGTLSGGEQQMLSIGRALMSRPRLLLVDELSLGLAPVVVQSLYRTLDQLGSGLTLLLVEQNVEQALKYTHKAYILETGSVVKWGPSGDLLEDTGIRQVYLGL